MQAKAVVAASPTVVAAMPPAPMGAAMQRGGAETQRVNAAGTKAVAATVELKQQVARVQTQANAVAGAASQGVTALVAPIPMAIPAPIAAEGQRGDAGGQNVSVAASMPAAVAETIKISRAGTPVLGKSTPGAAKGVASGAAVQVKGDALPSAAVAAMPLQMAEVVHGSPLPVAQEGEGGAQPGRTGRLANSPDNGVTLVSPKPAVPAEGGTPAPGAKVEVEVGAAGTLVPEAGLAPGQAGTSKTPAGETFNLPGEADGSMQAVMGAAVPEAARVNAGPAAEAGKGKPNPAEIAASSKKGSTAGVDEGDLQRATPEEAAVSAEAPEPIGTVIAEQNRAMDKAPQLQTEATFTVSTVATADSARGLQGAGTASAKASGLHAQRETQAVSLPAATTATFSSGAPATFIGKTIVANAPAATPTLGSGTLNEVMEAADKMTSDGQSQVELQVNLGDGQQLTVRLQMSEGSFHPIFKTESPELRQAIEQSWAGFRSSASERGLDIATPVFESPSSGGSFDATGSERQSQQPEGETAEANNPGSFTLPSPRNGSNQTATTPPAPLPVGSSVQMYA
jgi:hypothetical protein